MKLITCALLLAMSPFTYASSLIHDQETWHAYVDEAKIDLTITFIGVDQDQDDLKAKRIPDSDANDNWYHVISGYIVSKRELTKGCHFPRVNVAAIQGIYDEKRNSIIFSGVGTKKLFGNGGEMFNSVSTLEIHDLNGKEALLTESNMIFSYAKNPFQSARNTTKITRIK